MEKKDFTSILIITREMPKTKKKSPNKMCR